MFSYEVNVYPNQRPRGPKASATLIIDGVLSITDITIWDGKFGLFVRWPQREYQKEGETKYWSYVRFIGEREEGQRKTDFEAEIEKAILDKFKQTNQNQGRGEAAAARTAVTDTKALW